MNFSLEKSMTYHSICSFWLIDHSFFLRFSEVRTPVVVWKNGIRRKWRTKILVKDEDIKDFSCNLGFSSRNKCLVVILTLFFRGNAAFSKSANNKKLIFKLRCNNVLIQVALVMLSLFDKFKRDNFQHLFQKQRSFRSLYQIYFECFHLFLFFSTVDSRKLKKKSSKDWKCFDLASFYSFISVPCWLVFKRSLDSKSTEFLDYVKKWALNILNREQRWKLLKEALLFFFLFLVSNHSCGFTSKFIFSVENASSEEASRCTEHSCLWLLKCSETHETLHGVNTSPYFLLWVLFP